MRWRWSTEPMRLCLFVCITYRSKREVFSPTHLSEFAIVLHNVVNVPIFCYKHLFSRFVSLVFLFTFPSPSSSFEYFELILYCPCSAYGIRLSRLGNVILLMMTQSQTILRTTCIIKYKFAKNGLESFTIWIYVKIIIFVTGLVNALFLSAEGSFADMYTLQNDSININFKNKIQYKLSIGRPCLQPSWQN